MAVNVTELLADFAHRRGVDDRHVLVDVVVQQREVEAFVVGVQAVKEKELRERRRALGKHRMHAGDLSVARRHNRRQEAAQAVLVTFFFGECIIAVELRITEEFSSANLLAVSHKSFFIKNSAGYTIVRAVIKVCRLPRTLSP